MRHLPTTWLLALAWSAGACSTEEPGVVGPSPSVEMPSGRVHPSLSLQDPAPGSFWSKGAPIEIRGLAERGSSALSALTINEQPVAIPPDGFFSDTVRAQEGVNILSLRLESDDGGRAVEAVSVMGGEVHAPGATLPAAMYVHMGQELLDDDSSDLDDVASLIELLLVDEGFQDWLETLEFGENDDVRVLLFEAASSAVDLRATAERAGSSQPGCLATEVTIGAANNPNDTGFTLSLQVTGILALLGEEVTIEGSQATVSADLCPDIDDDTGALATEVRNPAIVIQDLRISTNEHPDMDESMSATHDALSALADEVLAAALANSLGALLDQFLGSFDFELPLWDDPPISGRLALREMTITEGAATLELSHTPTAPLGLRSPPVGAGSLATRDPAPDTRLSGRPLAIALSDDFANQMIFSFWWAGATEALGFEELLASMDTTALPEIFQPLTGATLNMGLPPTLLRSSNPDFPFDLAAGELTLTLDVGDDKRFVISLHVQAGAELQGRDDGKILLNLDNRAQHITVAVAIRDLPAGLDPGDVAALVRMVAPALIGRTDAALPGLAIPDIDLTRLSVLAGVEALQGKVLGLRSPAVRRTGSGGGFVVFEGNASLKDAPPASPPPAD